MKSAVTFLIVATAAIFIFSCGGEGKMGESISEKKEPSMQPETQGSARPLAQVLPQDRLNYYSTEPPTVIDDTRKYSATIRTSKGDIQVALDALYAPLHVNNFVFLARQGFFDGLLFHRYEPGFVIQGGDPAGQGTGGPGYLIPAEIGLPHVEGALAMARRGGPSNPELKSSGSQFYITLAPTHSLDSGYSVFGKVITGFDVVLQIRQGDLILSIDVTES